CSHDTLCQYLNKGRELLNRYRRHNGHEIAMEDIDPVDFVNWLISLKPTLQPTTWRFYRVAVDAVLGALPHPAIDTALDILEEDRRKNVLDAVSGNARGRLSLKRTSGRKVKRFPNADFQKLLRHLR